MVRNNLLSEQEIAFENDCKVIDLSLEYPGYTGKENFAIASDLSEEEIWDKYSNIVVNVSPFILLSKEHGEVIRDYHREQERLIKNDKRHLDIYGYKEGRSEKYRDDAIYGYVDPLQKYLTEEFKKDIEQRVHKALATLKPIQRRRLIKALIDKKSSREIAKEEGVNYSTVDKSINAAIKNFIENYESL
mgnify:FL=1